MKRHAAARAFCLAALLAAAPTFAQEKNLLEKTKDSVGKIGEKIAEPITDPKAAFHYWFEFDPKIEAGEKKNYNILPLIVVSPERGQGLGLKYAQESLLKKKDLIHLQWLHTLKNRYLVEFKYRLAPNRAFNLGGSMEMGYENFERFYYGTGNTTLKENETKFRPELFFTRIPILYGLSRNVYAGLSLNFQNWKIVSVGDEGILRRELPNLIGKDGSRLYTTTLLLRWDNRDHKTDASKGTYFEGNMEYSKKLLKSETDFIRSTLDARAFYPVLKKLHHVAGARIFVDYKTGDVPFYLLPELGGIFINRGLIEGRYRDNLMLAANGEYRFRIYRRLHWAFFVDAGNVFSAFKKISLSGSKMTGGTGMRYYVPPGNLLLARIDGGYSTEGFLVYLTFDQPF